MSSLQPILDEGDAAPGLVPLPMPLKEDFDDLQSWGVMSSVTRFLNAKTQHRPSQAMMDALGDIPATVNKILDGSADPAFYVCALDTGVGKSITLSQTIRAVRHHSGWQGDIGTVICVGRYTQVEAMIDAMRLNPRDFAVFVSMEEEPGRRVGELGLGPDRIDDAPILLTTHQMVERKLSKGKSWAEASEFFYKGKPRILRVWDEAILPGRPVTISRSELAEAVGVLKRHRKLSDQLWGLLEQLLQAEQGMIVEVPDLEGVIPLSSLWSTIGNQPRESIATTLTKLWSISGAATRVSNDGPLGNALLTYDRDLPDDIKPIMVLDAAALRKANYHQQDKGRGDLRWMKHVDKRYDHVSIRLKHGPAGKENYGDIYHERLAEVAEVINENPGRRCLVLSHKADGGKIKDAAADLLPLLDEPQRVSFCTWGQHDATNAFVDCDLVITASVIYLPRSAYEAIGRVASDTPVLRPYSDQSVNEIKRGMLAGDLLQGLSRGALRQCDGRQAHACDVYVVGARHSAIPGVIGELFPGAQVRIGWGDKAARSDMTTVQTKILDAIEETGSDDIEFKVIRDRLGMKHNAFSYHTTKPEFQEILIGHDWQIIGGHRDKRFIRTSRLTDALLAEAAE